MIQSIKSTEPAIAIQSDRTTACGWMTSGLESLETS
jgi:hypothetical protein